MSTPQPETGIHRSQDQVAHERSMAEVSDVLLNLEHAVTRAKKALKAVSKANSEPNVELALADTVRDLERLRKRLMQDTYFAGDAIRML